MNSVLILSFVFGIVNCAIPPHLLPTTTTTVAATSSGQTTAPATTTAIGGSSTSSSSTSVSSTTSSTTPEPTTVTEPPKRPCTGCPRSQICFEFEDNIVQKCLRAVTFSARSVVPAVAVQRRLEQNLAVRRIEYNQTELIFQALNAPAGNEYNAYIASYATQDGAVHERVLHALGQAVVDATYLPYTPPDPVDLYKQEFWRVGSPPNVIPPGADQQ